jgi:hypothetical protein
MEAFKVNNLHFTHVNQNIIQNHYKCSIFFELVLIKVNFLIIDFEC